VNYLETPNGQKIQLNVPGEPDISLARHEQRFWRLEQPGSRLFQRHGEYRAGSERYEALGTALNYVSQQRVTIDNSITQVTAASDAVTSVQTQLTTAQTNLMQADMATVSTQLSLGRDPADGAGRCDRATRFPSNSLFSKLQ
jgi:flagellar hook-associated protein 3 FlgL